MPPGKASGIVYGVSTLGNIAGGLEVERFGSVPVTRDEIIEELLLEARQHLGKQRNLQQLLPELVGLGLNNHHILADHGLVLVWSECGAPGGFMKIIDRRRGLSSSELLVLQAIKSPSWGKVATGAAGAT